MVFVTTADGETGISAISYAVLKEDIRDARRDLEDQLAEVDVVGSSGSSVEPGTDTVSTTTEVEATPTMLSAEQTWTNAEGRTITAAVRSVDGDKVTFVMAGRDIEYSVADLSAESREVLRSLLAE